MEIDLSIGAVGAALIGALASLLGLIISKEAKVSEFRQAWIDELRRSLAIFLTSINALVDLRKKELGSDGGQYEKERSLLDELNNSYYSIALRINPEEEVAKNLQSVMVKLYNFVSNNDQEHGFDELRINYIKTSAQLLKSEWKRVKHGEPMYRGASLIAGLGVLFLGAAFVILAVERNTEMPGTATRGGVPAISPTPATSTTLITPALPSPASGESQNR